MKIKPMYDRVVIEPQKEEDSKNGIFLGKTSQDKPQLGKVLYIGEGNENPDGKKLEMHVKVNDKVLYNKFSGVEAILDNKVVYIIRQTDILAIIDN